MQLPQGGLLGKIAGVVKKLQQKHISTHAANAGYFIVLSTFPALVLILS